MAAVLIGPTTKTTTTTTTTRCRIPEVGHHWKHEKIVIRDPRIAQVEKFLVQLTN
jgi:hypothetical protein